MSPLQKAKAREENIFPGKPLPVAAPRGAQSPPPQQGKKPSVLPAASPGACTWGTAAWGYPYTAPKAGAVPGASMAQPGCCNELQNKPQQTHRALAPEGLCSLPAGCRGAGTASAIPHGHPQGTALLPRAPTRPFCAQQGDRARS